MPRYQLRDGQRDVRFDHGKVTGRVMVTFTSPTSAHVSTEAYENVESDEWVYLRGIQWHVSAHFARNGSGEWEHSPGGLEPVRRKGDGYHTTAPRTYRAAILESCARVLRETHTPEIAHSVGKFNAENEVSRARRKVDEATAELATANEELAKAERLLSCYTAE